LNKSQSKTASVDPSVASRSGLHWRRRLLALGASAAALTLAAPAFAADPAKTPPKDASTVSEVVVNGIPYRETVLPTRQTTSSTYGLNLSVMDTPRNTTLLSTTQLETLNIDDPRAFSYLTSSSYTDAAFGTPNIPRVRGQYADLFYNGMRDSLTQNGYGVPVNFDAISNIDITKGPASVVDGPGPGVGGEVDILTKRPNMSHATEMVSATIDSVQNRRLVLDASMPIVPGDLAVLFSYSGEDSGSYFSGHYMHKNALYAALSWYPTDKYALQFNTEINVEQYTEDVGVNRANQALIDHGTYLQGTAVGGPANIQGYFTYIDLTSATHLNPKVTIDQTPGTSSRGVLYNAQLIQTYNFNSNLSLENNTLFMFQNSDNREAYYYADNSDGSYTFENRTELKGEFAVPFAGGSFTNQFVVGGTFRFAHTNYISNFNNEAVSVWDLSGNPNSWVLPAGDQTFGNAVPFKSVFGRLLYGVAGRDSVGGGNTGVSDLYDTAVFVQDRVEFSPQLSVLFGARIDALQDHSHDPLECSPDGAYTCLTGNPPNAFGDPRVLPADHTTGVYGLGNANLSIVYKLSPQISTYATFDWTQSPPNPNGGEGGINAYGQVPDSTLLRGNSFLYEAGVKFDLLNKKLFADVAVFDQKHAIPNGPGNTSSIAADTAGIELEANYQPTRSLYATASYSYIKTTLTQAPAFYDFPAQLGVNVDGGGNYALFEPHQSFQDPDQPQHVFNFLANYKFQSGFGVRTAMQVTGPIPLTASGVIDLNNLTNNGVPIPTASVTPLASDPTKGYYKSPVIPWQYTWNASVFYEFGKYTITASIYNLTDQRNWQPSPGYYGNDFLVRSDPRTYEIRLQAKF
jgi:outer membrane receptor protein involved in Fe transport